MRALLHVWRSLALCDSRLMTSGARCAQGHTRLAAPSAPPLGVNVAPMAPCLLERLPAPAHPCQ
jgi:hypothetical protein